MAAFAFDHTDRFWSHPGRKFGLEKRMAKPYHPPRPQTGSVGCGRALAFRVRRFPPERNLARSVFFAMRYAICSSDPVQISDAREAGFDYVESWTPLLVRPGESEAAFEDAVATIQRGGLPIECVNGFLVKGLVCVGPDADHDKVVEYADEVLRRLAKVGVSVCVFGSGWSRIIPDGWPREKAEAQFASLLVRLGRIAATHGVKIAIEPLRRAECNLANTVDEGVRFAQGAGSPAMGVLADFYHWSQNGETEDTLLFAKGRLFHTHVATAANRRIPGSEPCDFSVFFRALRAIGYDGRMSVEGSMPPEGPDRVEAFRLAVETLRAAERAAR